MPSALRLPEIRPPPSPSESHKRLICQMEESAEDSRLPSTLRSVGSRATSSYKEERTRSRPRCGSLDDFLSEPANRNARSGRQARAARPTQRQAIDDETAVPVEVFESMLRAGQQARGRATHTLSFAQPDGRPYLRHHNAAALEVALASTPTPMQVEDLQDEPELSAPSSPSPSFPPRPSSSCASELAGQHWEAHEGVALQVG